MITNNQSLEILIFDEISEAGVSAKDIALTLAANKGKPVNVKINSGGGLAFDGLAIYNALTSHDAPVTTEIVGLAGSAAAVIAMAGKPVRIHQSASLFIHRALGMAVGNARTMSDLVGQLEQMDNQIAAIFSNKTGMAIGEVLNYMSGKVDGTTFTAQQARLLKFVDEIIEEKKMFNSLDRIKVRLKVLEINETRKPV